MSPRRGELLCYLLPLKRRQCTFLVNPQSLALQSIIADFRALLLHPQIVGRVSSMLSLVSCY
jgi:hypothetical protein